MNHQSNPTPRLRWQTQFVFVWRRKEKENSSVFDFFVGEWVYGGRLLFSVDNGKVNALPLSLASVGVRSITQRL